VELELGWGLVQYGGLDALSERRHVETETLDRLLSLCDELELPITFNVVGHLLRDGALAAYDGDHPAGWFDDIPRTDPETDPAFYAPDLLDRIEASAVDHEIATHTFTHVECGTVAHDTLRWELDRVYELHDDQGLDGPVSLVPPLHSPPPRDVLADYPIAVVRSPRRRAPTASEAATRPGLALDVLTGAQPTDPPRVADGMVETYCTRYPSLTAPYLPMGQHDTHPGFRMLPVALRKRLHLWNTKRALSTVGTAGTSVHLWSHLWEMANDIQWPLVERYLRAVAAARDDNDIRVLPMRALNQSVRS
jgi:peptidoglycan/xylan/chitin deacetylase (PgdA/CDA1 family)